MSTKKIFNNEDDWAKIEQESINKNQKGYKIISDDINIEEIDPIEEIESASIEPDILEEQVTPGEYDDVRGTKYPDTLSENFLDEQSSSENFHDVLKTPRSADTSTDFTLEELVPPGEYDDVLQLTEYTGGGLMTNEHSDFVIAEYNKIDVINIDKAQQQTAKKFVSKITKFILDFNDVKLTKAHEDYIKQVGQLQLTNLTDLLTLVEVNKQMIGNIVARVNAVQAEDYAIINAYNNLINQHIKLIKEASNLYKSIPNVMKKMRADVLSNQELESANENDELITEEYGDKQFNNSKQMLRSILEKRKATQQEKE